MNMDTKRPGSGFVLFCRDQQGFMTTTLKLEGEGNKGIRLATSSKSCEDKTHLSVMANYDGLHKQNRSRQTTSFPTAALAF